MDYSSFDLSLHDRLIQLAFSELETVYDLTVREKKIFRLVKQYHHRCRVSIRGELVTRKHGLLSGSMFTNFLGTLINLAMIDATLGDTCLSHACGDDNLLISTHPLNVTRLKNVLSQDFQMSVVIDSENVKSDVFFLGFRFRGQDNMCVGSPRLILAKATFSEHFLDMSSDERLGLRVSSILSNYTNMLELVSKLIKDLTVSVSLPEERVTLTSEKEKFLLYKKHLLI
uniref:RdRp n=1 Tax=viral metagenome TaxID=1070528 RepID=A0A2V0RLJ6_9ZZZZ